MTTLDEAWAEVERLLPPHAGWFELFRRHPGFRDHDTTRYCAAAYPNDPRKDIDAFGPTPVAALQELAEALRGPLTVTVDLEGTPTLVGWELNDAR